MLPPMTGTDERLDAILVELRGLRGALEAAPVAWRQAVDRLADEVAAVRVAVAPVPPDPAADGESVELREPVRPNPKRRR